MPLKSVKVKLTKKLTKNNPAMAQKSAAVRRRYGGVRLGGDESGCDERPDVRTGSSLSYGARFVPY